MSQRILIIGGKGYIGSRLSLELKLAGYEVEDGVDLNWFTPSYLKNLHNGIDYKNLTSAFLRNYDVIILLAGHSSVQMCQLNPLGSYRNNVVNFVELIHKLEKYNPSVKFIYASSAGVYTDTTFESPGLDGFMYKDIFAAKENLAQCDPSNYYDFGKWEIDQYAKFSKLRFFGLRFGTVCGWSPRMRDLMINKMFINGKFNERIDLYNKDKYRAILNIEDLCYAVMNIISPTNKDVEHGIYNLASFSAKIGDIAMGVANYVGNVKIVDKGESPTYNFKIDTKKFRKAFKFSFNTSINDILNQFNRLRLSKGEAFPNRNCYKAYE
jgi:UDP-glucose 4-epimerase